ncbi:MAG: DUF2490 domain-containing protein [Flavobacteriia bacterium]|nr:DUF2490 domain-containing protein [Flavobacteriia bacterium]
MNRFVLYLIFIYPFYSISQFKDLALWMELDLEKKINTQHSILFSQNLRLNENLSQLTTHFSQLTYCFKKKDWKFNTSYRFSEKFKFDNSINYRHRFMLDIIYRKKIQNFSLSLRERIQYSSEYPLDNFRRKSVLTSRHRLEFSYDLFYFDLGLSGEFFLEKAYDLNEYRTIISLNKTWNKYISSELYYGIHFDRSSSVPSDLYIIGLGSKYRF